MMTNCYRCHAVCLLLSLLSQAVTTTDFIDKLYNEFSTSENKTGLSSVNIEEIAARILDGNSYRSGGKPCLIAAGNNCSREECDSLTSHANRTEILSKSEFSSECPQILYSLTQDCVKRKAEDIFTTTATTITTDGVHTVRPPIAQVWGYGFLLVTLINLCSLAGILVLPMMQKQFYSVLLMFLISLAVGSLAANGILVLIPEAFEIIEEENYLWRACVIMCGVYLFFVTERLLKIITHHCATSKEDLSQNRDVNPYQGSIPIQTYLEIDRSTENPPSDVLSTHKSEHGLINNEVNEVEGGTKSHLLQYSEVYKVSNGAVEGNTSPVKPIDEKKPIATVAWMIIFGDAFHNFIDGLSIGAAFTESILLGVSICVAVFCEELPHELGDFAILLNAGMSKKKALLFNFLSACTCYLGLAIGITLAEVAHATPWILGLAGGMFLYISLADMMPEMNHAAEEYKDQPGKVFLIQNLGLLTGFGVILLVARFGGDIQL